MDIRFENYQEKYKPQLEKLFEDFQDFLVKLDPLKRLRRPEGYGSKILVINLKEVEKNEGLFYLALDNEKVVGFTIGIIHRPDEGHLDSYPASHGHVTELYVDSSCREQGIGKKLMEKVEAYFKEKGCEYSWVEVFVPNETAHEVYKKLGYHDRDIEMVKKL